MRTTHPERNPPPPQIDWYYENKGGAEFIFPDEWERYLAPIPPAQRGNLVKAYNKLLTSDDREERLRAAKAWTGWEMATSYLMQARSCGREARAGLPSRGPGTSRVSFDRKQSCRDRPAE